MSGINYVLAIDVETTHQNLYKGWMPEFGAVLVNIQTLQVLAKFAGLMTKPDEYRGWERRCVEEFWSQQPRYQYLLDVEAGKVAQANSPTLEMCRFVQWIEDTCPLKETVIVFDTAGFDASWMNYYLGRFANTSLHYLFGEYRPTRDISSYMFGYAETPPNVSLWGSTKAALRKLGAEAPKCQDESTGKSIEHDHNPVNDATVIGVNAAFIFRETSTF